MNLVLGLLAAIKPLNVVVALAVLIALTVQVVIVVAISSTPAAARGSQKCWDSEMHSLRQDHEFRIQG